MEQLDTDFWEHRYMSKTTGWDLGEISTPIKTYVDQLTDKDISILIPGAGNAHEAQYLHQQGFKHVYVNDITTSALENLKNRVPSFPKEQLLHANFFDLNQTFDLIIEQTFFCAIHPALRPDYAKQAHRLLKKQGKLVGLLFSVPLNDNHPPFGGHQEEYQNYFEPYFNIKTMAPCYNSVESRKGRELFIQLLKK